MLSAASSQAATLTVTTTLDQNDVPAGALVSLREAIRDAASGDTIIFDAALEGLVISAVSLPSPLVISGKTLTIDGSSLTSRSVTIARGSLFLDRIFTVEAGSDVTLIALTIANGFAAAGTESSSTGNGGAIANLSSTLRIRRCTLENNSTDAAGFGGAIFNSGAATLILTNTTIRGGAADRGGGIYNDDTSVVTLNNATIAENTASSAGGGIFNAAPATLTLRNSLVALNMAPVGADIGNSNGTVNAPGNNLIGRNGTVGTVFPVGSPNGNGDFAGSAAAPLDPLLAPYSDYGGLTKSYHPFADSLCIDNGGAGSPLGDDQRGYARAVDGSNPPDATVLPDIGAIEAGTALRVNILVDENDGALGLGFGDSLREVVEAATTPGDRVTFDPVLTGTTLSLTVGGLSTFGRDIVIIDASPLVAADGSPRLGISGSDSFRILDIPTRAALFGVALKNGRADLGSALRLKTFLNRLTLYRCELTGNESTGTGGALAIAPPPPLFPPLGTTTALIIDTTFSDNVCPSGEGGAINNGFVLITEVFNCTFDNNSALNGGAVMATSGLIIIKNSTFDNNSAALEGGALGVYLGRADLHHVTITGNFGGAQGGGIMINGDFLTLENTIVAENTATGSGDDIKLPAVNTFTVSGANLIGDNDTVVAFFPAGPLVGTAAAPLSPGLAPFESYGGPTKTRPPLPGSPVIENALLLPATTALDQRGSARLSGPFPDLGAVEAFALSTAPPGFIDTDSDGIDDRLEPAYGFVVGDDNSSADSDNDGSTDAEELQNMTDPLDGSDFLRILGMSFGAGFNAQTNRVFDITWKSFPGLNYTIESNTALDFSSPAELGDFDAADFVRSTTLTLAPADNYLRVRRN
ncbi:MAG: choice-of-anchor Q domain-containing protein [Verrucomicrobiales bacterium]